MPRLNKRTIDGLKSGPEDSFVWDDALPAFGLRIKRTGVKSFFIQYRNKAGRSRRYTIGRYGVFTADQARDEARLALAAAALGRDPAEERKRERGAQTVADLCAEYLEKAVAGLILTRRGKQPKKASTLYTDRGRIERHILPLLGSRKISDIQPRDIEKFRDDIASGKTAKDIKTGPRGRAIVKGGAGTSARTLGLLGGIFTYAVKTGLRPDNPVRGIDRAKHSTRNIRLEAGDYRRIGKALAGAEERGVPWQAVLSGKAIVLTGARRGEIEKLKRAEIDLDAQVLRLGDSKTGRSIRPIGKDACKVLSAALARSSGEYVFPSTRTAGKHFTGLPKIWREQIDRKIPPHGMRHGLASVAEELGYTLPTIKALLGHAKSGVTEGYIHKADPALVSAADKVSGWIASAIKGARA